MVNLTWLILKKNMNMGRLLNNNLLTHSDKLEIIRWTETNSSLASLPLKSGFSFFDEIKNKIFSIIKILEILTWKDLIFCILIYSLYFIKSPINVFIYSNFNYVIGFLLALVISLLISKVTNKLFNKLLKIIEYDSILKLPIVDCIPVFYYNVCLYIYNVVYYAGANRHPSNYFQYMPKPSDAMIRDWDLRYRFLRNKLNTAQLKVNSLEPVASAIDRDITISIKKGQKTTDDNHVALVHIFEEQVRDAKKEIIDITYTKYVPYVNPYGFHTCRSLANEFQDLRSLSTLTNWF